MLFVVLNHENFHIFLSPGDYLQQEYVLTEADSPLGPEFTDKQTESLAKHTKLQTTFILEGNQTLNQLFMAVDLKTEL